jgi:hypothetical protein
VTIGDIYSNMRERSDDRTDGIRLDYFVLFAPTDLLEMPGPIHGSDGIRFPKVDPSSEPIVLVCTDLERLIFEEVFSG